MTPDYKTVKVRIENYELLELLAREAGIPVEKVLNIVIRHGFENARKILRGCNLINS